MTVDDQLIVQNPAYRPTLFFVLSAAFQRQQTHLRHPKVSDTLDSHDDIGFLRYRRRGV